ncbi:hypothetical protein MRB53_013650 [Persea americana]|uniref:Uncharacterized protein n=1 Tax=Persea americana TaxID=3435 RepID=A0ACC2K8M1_PERAE|nr:hypothetical protein MRB53_013650 [Persea americana]
MKTGSLVMAAIWIFRNRVLSVLLRSLCSEIGFFSVQKLNLSDSVFFSVLCFEISLRKSDPCGPPKIDAY